VDRDELGAWLRLSLTPGVGRVGARHLLAACGSPEGVFAQTHEALAGIVGSDAASSLLREPDGLASRRDRTLEWLAQDPRRAVVALGDPRYPLRWLQTPDPPLFVHAEGRLELLQADALAMVGSRNPTPQGEDTARDFARALSEAGRTIVSGLALGVDAAAHAGALEGVGSTVAIVGTGMDLDYPRRNASLARRIRAAGLVLSEYPLGAEPLAPHFPQRNRLIAGLARGTVVIEAALQSGSLITARQALEQGAEVFAVPGSIHSPQSRGCHALIKQGAKLIETAEDVLQELPALAAAPGPQPPAPATRVPTDPTDDPVLRAMGFDPVTQDALADRTGWPAARLAARLLELEIAGQVARLPGQRYQRQARG
jgi:DNA processing protein